MKPRFQRPKGTQDVLPDEAKKRRSVFDSARKAFDDFRFSELETPIFENSGLFSRGLGESTDVVSKEMFEFRDQGDRTLALRPEGTAAVCRAYVENAMHKWPEQPVRLWYGGPFFRQEAPQHGRFRQFTQIGAEVLGEDGPWIDAEMVGLAARVVFDAGVADCTIRIGSLGSSETRAAYRARLQDFLRANADSLAEDVVKRIEVNPLRAFDSKDPATIETMSKAPTLLESLEGEDLAHFEQVRFLLKGHLGMMDIPFEVVPDGTLVRGLDYYSHTVFELTSSKLGAQSAIGGGGRYNGLVEELGGPPTPAVGWAIGVERVVMAADWIQDETGPPIYVAVEEGFDERRLLVLLTMLRMHDQPVMFGGVNRSLRSQLKQADRLRAEWTVVLQPERDGIYYALVKSAKERDNPQTVCGKEEEFTAAVFDALGLGNPS